MWGLPEHMASMGWGAKGRLIPNSAGSQQRYFGTVARGEAGDRGRVNAKRTSSAEKFALYPEHGELFDQFLNWRDMIRIVFYQKRCQNVENELVAGVRWGRWARPDFECSIK